jgi:hypothetical protein
MIVMAYREGYFVAILEESVATKIGALMNALV